MHYLREICEIKELVRFEQLGVEEARDQVSKFIEKSIMYPKIKSRYSYLITLIETSIYPHELIDGINKYLDRLLILYDEKYAQNKQIV